MTPDLSYTTTTGREGESSAKDNRWDRGEKY